jgi:hypothetical protein
LRGCYAGVGDMVIIYPGEFFHATVAKAGPFNTVAVCAGINHLPENKLPDKIKAQAVGIETGDQGFQFPDFFLPESIAGRAHEFHPFVFCRAALVSYGEQGRVCQEGSGVLEHREYYKYGNVVFFQYAPEGRIGSQFNADKGRVDAHVVPHGNEFTVIPGILVDFDPDYLVFIGDSGTAQESNENCKDDKISHF